MPSPRAELSCRHMAVAHLIMEFSPVDQSHALPMPVEIENEH